MNALRIAVLCCIALAMVLVAGCKSKDSTPPVGSGPASSMVRFVHASPNAPVVDVVAGGKAVAQNLAYMQVTDYAPIVPDTYKVEVFPTGTRENALIKKDVTVAAGKSYTALVIGMLENIKPLLLVDDMTAPPAGQAKVRFVHVSPDAPAIDISIPASSLTLTRNLSFGTASPYITVTGGTYDVNVMPSGQSGNIVLVVNDVNVVAGNVYTVVIMGRVATNTLMSQTLIDNP